MNDFASGIQVAVKTPSGKLKRFSSRLRILPAALVFAIASAPLAGAGALRAEELPPYAGMALQIGDMKGVAFYTLQEEGYHVIAILAARPGSPVRFESMLSPGQKMTISAPPTSPVNARTVEFSRQGDRLLVETRQTPTD
jgi:hypothetical protein